MILRFCQGMKQICDCGGIAAGCNTIPERELQIGSRRPDFYEIQHKPPQRSAGASLGGIISGQPMLSRVFVMFSSTALLFAAIIDATLLSPPTIAVRSAAARLLVQPKVMLAS